MTEKLRTLLTQAVPDDAPTLDPQALARSARRVRTHRRALAAGLAGAVVATGGAYGVLSTGADDSRVADQPTTAPYDAPACPATLPELDDAATAIVSLDGVTSVRLCPDLEAVGLTRPITAAQEQALLEAQDALIEGLDEFGERIGGIGAFDAGRCAALSFFNSRQSLQFSYADGHSELVPTAMCFPIEIAGRAVDGGFLGRAYLAALDQQRDNLTYARSAPVPLSCAPPEIPSPVRPGREEIVAAIRCTPEGDLRPLDADQLTALRDAWRNPGPVPQDPNDPEELIDESICTAPTDTPSYLVLATDHGDLTRLSDTGCGVLVWSSWELSGSVGIPITLAELGLAP